MTSTSASRVRPREREGEALAVILVDKSSGKDIGPISPELSSFLAPMDRKTFMAEHFEKRRALAIKVHPSLREKRLEFVKTLLHGFNPRLMLENSNSAADGISVWMKLISGANQGDLRSIKVSPENAVNCYQAGHSLYFRGTEDVEAAFIPSFMQQLGFSFGSYFRDGARRGECEVFASHPGHMTTWHTDFQENFTIQLMGQKKWYLRKADIAFPFRACATHFRDEAAAKILRTQHAIAHLDASSNGKQFSMVPDDIEETCETIVLQPGDVLFHPAGMWHKVETLAADQNSLSINFSLFPLQWGEMMQECLQTMMLRMTHWRRPVMIPNHINEDASSKDKKEAEDQARTFTRRMGDAMIESLKNELSHVTSTHLLPSFVLDSATKTMPKMVKFNNEGEIVAIKIGSKLKKDEKIIKKFTSAFPKIFSSGNKNKNHDEDADDDDEEVIFKRNPMGVIVEVNEELLALMGDEDKKGSSDDEDDDEDEHDHHHHHDHDHDHDEEEESEDESDEDEDESEGNENDDDIDKSKKPNVTTFDLWSNFVADEANFGAPAVRLTIQVPTKTLRKVFITLANARAEVPLKKKVFTSTAVGDILPFLCYVGFFSVSNK